MPPAHPPPPRPPRHRRERVRADPADPGDVQRRHDRVQPADPADPEAAERVVHPRRPDRARPDADRGRSSTTSSWRSTTSSSRSSSTSTARRSSPASAYDAAAKKPVVNWQRTGAGTLTADERGRRGGQDRDAARRTSRIASGETIIAAEVYYAFEPLFGIGMAPRTIRKVAYYKPRLGSARHAAALSPAAVAVRTDSAGRRPRCETQRSSVKASIPALPPKRP